jgi:hypothetical protein
MKGFNSEAPISKVKSWQIRWNEPLGVGHCPYAYRWVLFTPFFSFRVHHFLRSDDKRFYHDHAWDFWTLILKNHYVDVSEKGRVLRDTFKIYKVEAEHAHYVEVPDSGCWTLVFCNRPRRKWGFWVEGAFKRPLKYFNKFGHPPCNEQ